MTKDKYFHLQLGVNSLILVGLERVPRFEDAALLEFGRGFRYTRPLRLNILDLDYELMEELVSGQFQCAEQYKILDIY